MAVRAVFFDLGDTLMFEARSPNFDSLYATIAARLSPLVRSWGAPALDLPRLLSELYPAIGVAQPARRDAGYEVDAAFIARGALAEYGLEVSAEQARAFWRATAVGIAPWGCQLYPDTLDTLRRLRSARMPAALVSNTWSTAEMVRGDLALSGITEELLPVIVTSTDVTRPKPRAEIFQSALEATSVGAGDAVFVGDNLDADVRGAKALGMTTVWKLNGRYEVPRVAEADFAIHDLWELFTLGVLPDQGEAVLPLESLTPHEDDNAGRY